MMKVINNKNEKLYINQDNIIAIKEYDDNCVIYLLNDLVINTKDKSVLTRMTSIFANRIDDEDD